MIVTNYTTVLYLVPHKIHKEENYMFWRRDWGRGKLRSGSPSPGAKTGPGRLGDADAEVSFGVDFLFGEQCLSYIKRVIFDNSTQAKPNQGQCLSEQLRFHSAFCSLCISSQTIKELAADVYALVTLRRLRRRPAIARAQRPQHLRPFCGSVVGSDGGFNFRPRFGVTEVSQIHRIIQIFAQVQHAACPHPQAMRRYKAERMVRQMCCNMIIYDVLQKFNSPHQRATCQSSMVQTLYNTQSPPDVKPHGLILPLKPPAS
ncbi:hypothetical protein BKA59DRAFT_551007 [Fusarium tricinctum]|uniref:Uncharacterized protein n=1 Tax=Fusarium tricinctum TaxID=61284 RepID=A0A8K0WHC5_9HYPO|nr:hypothetical protein BKA59DRAFT_551007 [Fusarium tricinctum]